MAPRAVLEPVELDGSTVTYATFSELPKPALPGRSSGTSSVTVA
ncbi:hypothetical protein ACFXJ8_22325 [Nonomuraea sp. NPDC059194]